MSSEISRRVVPGTNVTTMDVVNGTRTGIAQRQDAISRVEKMMKQGYLTGDEAATRVRFLENSHTEAEIKAALADLPATKPRLSWDSPRVYVPVLVGLIMVFINLIITGGIVMSPSGGKLTTGLLLWGVPMVTAGVIGTVASVAGLMIKTLND